MIKEKDIYKIILDKRLILKCYFGLFSMSDFISCVNENGKKYLDNPASDSFIDKEITSGIGEIHEYVEYIEGQSNLYAKREISFVTSTPRQRIFEMILDQFKNDTLTNIKTFSTLSEVTNWLGLPYSDLNVIRDYFTEFKNST